MFIYVHTNITLLKYDLAAYAYRYHRTVRAPPDDVVNVILTVILKAVTESVLTASHEEVKDLPEVLALKRHELKHSF